MTTLKTPSTPTKPPGKPARPRWKPTLAGTAQAASPSTLARYGWRACRSSMRTPKAGMGGCKALRHGRRGARAIPSATHALSLRLGAGLHVRRGARIFARQLVEGRAGGILLTQALQRHRQFEQALRRLGVSTIVLIALEECPRGGAVLAPYVERFSQPILGIAGERIVRKALQKIFKRGLGGRIVALQEGTVGRLVKLLGRHIRFRCTAPGDGGQGPAPDRGQSHASAAGG